MSTFGKGMGSLPLNLALRFILELSTLASMGYWSWSQHEGAARWLLLTCLPVGSAAIWGVFTVPDDPSRSGSAPVPIPGGLRLLLELLFFFFGAFLLFESGKAWVGSALAVMVTFHYSLSFDRIRWLINKKKKTDL